MKTPLGGFKRLSLVNATFTSGDSGYTATVPGVYDFLEENNGKPVVVENLNFPGVTTPLTAMVTPFVVSDDIVLCVSPVLDQNNAVVLPYLSVDDDDIITAGQVELAKKSDIPDDSAES